MLRAAACCFWAMSGGGDSEEPRRSGPSRVADSNQLERRSLSKNDGGDSEDLRRPGSSRVADSNHLERRSLSKNGGGDSDDLRRPGPSRVADSNHLERRSLSKNGGGDSEEPRRPGPSRVADSNQLERRSLSKDCAGEGIDERLLIDPRLLYIGAKIGEGAYGKVYNGMYCGQIVAIKVLNGGSTLEEKATLGARFVREVNMISRVKHENLVKFIGACRGPFMVLVTELLPGMSLKKYLISIRPKKLDLHVAISFALDIAHAMDCLHAHGIIHRDLKSDNLLLTANEKSLKLVDFGLAREETVTEMMTAERGTYRWMAPELYSTVTLRQGEKKYYNNKVDVYSFGIVLWELLTNRMPFEGMTNLQAAYAAAFKQMRPPIPDDTPPELAFIVQSCWVEDPSLRPNFSQIIRMLNSFLFALQPPTPHSNDVPPVMSCGRDTVTNASSSRMGWKLSRLRQLFAAKRTGNSR